MDIGAADLGDGTAERFSRVAVRLSGFEKEIEQIPSLNQGG